MCVHTVYQNGKALAEFSWLIAMLLQLANCTAAPPPCVCLILAGQRVNSLRMALKGRRAVDYMHIHPHPKRSNLSLPTWSMLGSLWYILCWYSLFFVYVNWVFIHLWPVFVTLSVCRRVSTYACTLHTHISCTENRNPWAVYFYEDLSVCVSV